jgi:hypothetical protein
VDRGDQLAAIITWSWALPCAATGACAPAPWRRCPWPPKAHRSPHWPATSSRRLTDRAGRAAVLRVAGDVLPQGVRPLDRGGQAAPRLAPGGSLKRLPPSRPASGSADRQVRLRWCSGASAWRHARRAVLVLWPVPRGGARLIAGPRIWICDTCGTGATRLVRGAAVPDHEQVPLLTEPLHSQATWTLCGKQVERVQHLQVSWRASAPGGEFGQGSRIVTSVWPCARRAWPDGAVVSRACSGSEVTAGERGCGLSRLVTTESPLD